MIFLGLGNIQKKYARHSLGHIFLNQLAEQNNCDWIIKDNYQYCHYNDDILIKPNDYLTSNDIVLELFKNFDFVKHDLIIVHDDIFLPIGKIRIKLAKNRSSYKSIQLFTQYYSNFIELKIGIDSIDNVFNESKAKNKSLYMINYINADFSINEYQLIMNSINKIINNIDIFNTNSLLKIQTLFNSNQFLN